MGLLAPQYGTLDLSGIAATLEVSSPHRIPSENVPRRHGRFVGSDQTLDARVVRVSGSSNASTSPALQLLIRTIETALRVGERNFQIWDDRFLLARVSQGLSWGFVEGSAGTVANWTFDLEADDPFWQSTTLESNSHNYTSSGQSDIETNPGTAFVFPTITVTIGAASGASFTLNNTTTGDSLTYTPSGGLSASDVIVIDTANFTLTRNTVNDVNSLTSGSVFWFLEGTADATDGDNAVTYTGPTDATTPTTVLFDYRPRDW